MVFPWDRVLQTKFLGQSMLTLPCHFLRVLFKERKGQQRLFLRKSSRTHADPGFLPPHPTLKPGQVSALRVFFFFFLPGALRLSCLGRIRSQILHAPARCLLLHPR